MYDFIWETILNLLVEVANLILAPINIVVNNLFPDLSSHVSTFNDFIATNITPTVNYFFHIIPPMSRNILLVYLGMLVAFYTITLVAHFVIKVIEIIKNVKIW